MFKRVLLCYDSTEAGRRALRRGAELAVLLGAQVHVLSIAPDGVANAAVLAGAAGQACIVDEAAQYPASQRRFLVVRREALNPHRPRQVLRFCRGKRRR
jgi:nucleotide-binding universal stress UspA family protein